MHPCAAGCGKKVNQNLLMCANDWYKVSPETRRLVNRLWRVVSGDYQESLDESREAVRQYQAAREKAIAEVEAWMQKNAGKPVS